MSFFENTRKPVGLGGKIMVAMMNFGHSAMAEWGLRFLQPAPDAMVLDCGCGGGANIKTLLKLCPNGKVQVWGDRIFEKCGIGRDEGGDGGKTLEIRGKRRLSARDGGANYQQS